MENSDIYIFEESSPLLQSQRNVLFHDNHTDTTITPTYLVELPEYEPNAPVPPAALSEKRRRSRGASIINPRLQNELTEQEQEEPLEYFMTSNLTNYRKSILVKDPDETHGIITAESRDNEMKFEVVEPLQGLKIEKGSSVITYSGNNQAKPTSNIEEATRQGKHNKGKLVILNNSNLKNEVEPLKNRSEDNQSLNFLLKKEIRREVPNNAFFKLAQQSPFTNKTLDTTTSVPLQLSLIVIASDDSVGSVNNRDNQLKNDTMEKSQQFWCKNRNDSPKQNGHTKATLEDPIRGNKHYSDKKPKQSDLQTRQVVQIDVGGQKHSNRPQNISHEHEMHQHQSTYLANMSQAPIEVYFQGDNVRDEPGRQNQIKRKPEGSPRRQRDNTPHKSAKKVFCVKRYHVQLLKQEKQDKSFNVCFAIENCDMDMKYEGPVKITNYYTIDKYKPYINSVN